MYVIADIEWIERRGRQIPTQISALRVDGAWNVVASFFSRIRPERAEDLDLLHVAFRGGLAHQFLGAPGAEDVFRQLEAWLDEDANAVLCFWFSPSVKVYKSVRAQVLPEKTRPTLVFSPYMQSALGVSARQNPYKLARARAIDVPALEHDARNDTAAILKLFRGISFSQEELWLPPRARTAFQDTSPYRYDEKHARLHRADCTEIPEDAVLVGLRDMKAALKRGCRTCGCVQKEYMEARRAKMSDEIARTQYTYIYAVGSRVFHRHDCGTLLGAREIRGAIKYETIERLALSPCKLCHPTKELPPRSSIKEASPLSPWLCKAPSPFLTGLTRNAKKRHGAQAAEHLKPPASASVQEKPIEKELIAKGLLGKKGKSTLSRAETKALSRLEQSQRERTERLTDGSLTAWEKKDVLTLTQPGLVFFVAKGYHNFHLRECSRLKGLGDIRGFDTFAKAKRAGYTPCRFCHPTSKQDLLLSIPITNRVRENETLHDLITLCERLSLSYANKGEYFHIETPVGKWKIKLDTHPVAVYHINLVKGRPTEEYHRQHRAFLSFADAVYYIRRHDATLLSGRGGARADEGKMLSLFA